MHVLHFSSLPWPLTLLRGGGTALHVVWLDVCKDFYRSHAEEGPTLPRIGRLEGSVILYMFCYL